MNLEEFKTWALAHYKTLSVQYDDGMGGRGEEYSFGVQVSEAETFYLVLTQLGIADQVPKPPTAWGDEKDYYWTGEKGFEYNNDAD